MRLFAVIADWVNEHPGQAVGAFIGFIAGLLILIFGLMSTLLIVVLAFLGFLIGSLRDRNVTVMDKVKEIFSFKKKD